MAASIAELCQTIRTHKTVQHLITLESVLSLPVPWRTGSQAFLRFLVYVKGAQKTAEGRYPIYAPYARLSVDCECGDLAEFVRFSFLGKRVGDAPGTPIGYYRHPAIAMLNYDELMALQSRFRELTEKIMSVWPRATSNESDTAVVREYKSTFAQLAEPSLLSMYRELNPSFFAWLEQGGAR